MVGLGGSSLSFSPISPSFSPDYGPGLPVLARPFHCLPSGWKPAAPSLASAGLPTATCPGPFIASFSYLVNSTARLGSHHLEIWLGSSRRFLTLSELWDW